MGARCRVVTAVRISCANGDAKMAKAAGVSGFRGAADWTDMSDFLVHLTREPTPPEPRAGSTAWVVPRRAYDSHMSILASQTLRAVGAFGALRTRRKALQGVHRAVCFSEIPLGNLGRLAGRKSSFGIAFTKDFLIGRGAAPVWYLTRGSEQWRAMKGLADASVADPAAPIWKLTPFIDESRDGRFRYQFEWEREWRVVGDVRFTAEDVAFMFVPEQHVEDAIEFFASAAAQNLGPSYFCPIIDPSWDLETVRVEVERQRERAGRR